MKKLTLDHGSCTVYWGGQNLGVTLGEFRILAKLATRPGCAFSYRHIYDALREVPGFHAGDGERGISANCRSAVKRIRRKLCRLDPTLSLDDVIRNYMAFGYSLKPEVLDTADCCPSCGQLILLIKRETVVVAPAPEPAPIVPIALVAR